MNVSILAVGGQKSGPEQTLVDEYCRRFGRTASNLGLSGIDQTVVKSGGGKSREGERLLSKLTNSCHAICLDERGTAMTSMALANRIRDLRDQGSRQLVFIIGGAEGISDAVRTTCRETIAFGPQTWPHMLVRAMLAEQLYRAATILAGTPYHKA
ncbi:MAG: 23S rRNA (pseudouridine(1915)-N(3))-methyltransferase RlmH [Pseudomonadota bacterium]